MKISGTELTAAEISQAMTDPLPLLRSDRAAPSVPSEVAAFDGAGNASDQSSPPVVTATASDATGPCDDDLDDDGDGNLD